MNQRVDTFYLFRGCRFQIYQFLYESQNIGEVGNFMFRKTLSDLPSVHNFTKI